MDDIKILVCCHKECEIPHNTIFLPIQVGKKRSGVDLGIQSDCEVNGSCDGCDNISLYNHIYCEMTAMYWAWKNIRNLYPELKYIGLCHYRRYFRTKRNYNNVDLIRCRLKSSVKTLLGLNQAMQLFDLPEKINDVNSAKFNDDQNKLKRIIKNSDIVYTQPIIYINNSVRPCFEVIGREYISILEEIVNKEYAPYFLYLKSVLNGKKLVSSNMLVMRVEYLDEYCRFIFDVLNKHIKYLIDNRYLTSVDEKVFSRVPGYLAEILTATYIEYKKSKGIITVEVGKYFVD